MPKQAIGLREALAKGRECSFNNTNTFQDLKTMVKDHVSSQQSNEFSPTIRFSNLIKYHEVSLFPDGFSVTRQSEESAFKPRIGQREEFDEVVAFKVEGRILRIEYSKRTDPSSDRRETVWERIVSPVVIRSGECRYEIDGSGTFVLWEVVRDALKPLFYPDLV